MVSLEKKRMQPNQPSKNGDRLKITITSKSKFVKENCTAYRKDLICNVKEFTILLTPAGDSPNMSSLNMSVDLSL